MNRARIDGTFALLFTVMLAIAAGKAFGARGKGAIVNIASVLADRVAVLDGGRVVEHGPTGEVLARPQSAFAARIAGLNTLLGRSRSPAAHTALAAAVGAALATPLQGLAARAYTMGFDRF